MNPDGLQPASSLDDGRRRVARAVGIGSVIGAAGGIALVFILRELLGLPENFVPKAIAIVLLIAALGGFVGLMVNQAGATRTKAR